MAGAKRDIIRQRAIEAALGMEDDKDGNWVFPKFEEMQAKIEFLLDKVADLESEMKTGGKPGRGKKPVSPEGDTVQ